MAFSINTPRLIMRKWDINDAPFLFELNEDPSVTLLTGDGSFGSLENTINFIKEYDQYSKFGHGRWIVEVKNRATPIGWCGLKNQIKDLGIIDLGYRFIREAWGKGYGTEAAFFALKTGFIEFDMKVITGRVDEKNIASVRILEKIGMEYYKTDKCHGSMAKYYNISSKQFNELISEGFYKKTLGFE